MSTTPVLQLPFCFLVFELFFNTLHPYVTMELIKLIALFVGSYFFHTPNFSSTPLNAPSTPLKQILAATPLSIVHR